MKRIYLWGLPITLLLKASPLPALVNGQYATQVVGHSDLTSVAAEPLSAASLNKPSDATYDPVNHRLFVADHANGRVLLYDTNSLATGMSAYYVIGMPDFATPFTAPIYDQTHVHPYSLAYDPDHERLFVSDQIRILVFDVSIAKLALFPTFNLPAIHVLGQLNFTDQVIVGIPDMKHFSNNGAGLVKAGVGGLTYDPAGERLFATDAGFRRVLIFNFPGGVINDGPDADHVLGFPDLDSAPPPTDINFKGPTGTAYDPLSHQLFVSDTDGNRVMVFDLSNGITDYMPASYVLGQSGFTSYMAGITQSGMSDPGPAYFDTRGQKLYLPDMGANRLLVFNLGGGGTFGTQASVVLGQPDFTSFQGAPNPTTAGLLQYPGKPAYDPVNGRLFVPDPFNNRLVVYHETNLGQTPDACTHARLSICGTLTAAEDSSLLVNTPVFLINKVGINIARTKTDSTGVYNFVAGDGLFPSQTYSVTPALGRKQVALPLVRAVESLPSNGVKMDLQIRGRPGTLKIINTPPGSAMLISTSNYTGANAPLISARSSSGSSGLYSTTARSDGTATLQVAAGLTYYLTCWVAEPQGDSVIYNRKPAIGSSLFPAVTVSGITSMACEN